MTHRLVPSVFWLLVVMTPRLAWSRTSTVFFRKHSLGNIFALDNSAEPQIERELEGTADAARLVSLTLSPTRLYWSDHRSIRSAFINGSDVRTDVGMLVRMQWTGVNFGATQDELVELSVLETRCISVLHWSPTEVSCFVAVPLVGKAPNEDDCVIRTRHGDMRGVALNRYEEMRASGVLSPIVERLVIDATLVQPMGLVVDGDNALFWANAIDGMIYRSSLRDTAIDVVQRNAWEVKGMSLLRWTQPPSLELLYSLEGKGLIQRTKVIHGVVSASQTLLRSLQSPRGVALDPQQQFLYFTEKTGRIYRTLLSDLEPLSTDGNSSMTLAQPQLLLTLSSLSRLDGLAVDDTYVYWCESNSNVVARASVDSLEREVLYGGSADSILSWPRAIALKSMDGAKNAVNDDYYYVEYTGRVTKGKGQVLVNDLRVSPMKYLDLLIQQRESQLHFYALE